jgi:tetratricopeptide (TPR) repeat protein
MAVKRKPRFTRHYRKGKSAMNRGRYDIALSCFDRFLEIAHKKNQTDLAEYAECRFYMSLIAISGNDGPGTRAHLHICIQCCEENGLTFTPTYVLACRHMASLNLKSGHTEFHEARDYLERGCRALLNLGADNIEHLLLHLNDYISLCRDSHQLHLIQNIIETGCDLLDNLENINPEFRLLLHIKAVELLDPYQHQVMMFQIARDLHRKISPFGDSGLIYTTIVRSIVTIQVMRNNLSQAIGFLEMEIERVQGAEQKDTQAVLVRLKLMLSELLESKGVDLVRSESLTDEILEGLAGIFPGSEHLILKTHAQKTILCILRSDPEPAIRHADHLFATMDEAKEIREEVIHTLNGVSMCFMQAGQLDLASSYNRRTRHLIEKHDYHFDRFQIEAELIRVRIVAREGKFDLADKLLHQILEHMDDLNGLDSVNHAHVLIGLGEILLDRKKHTHAAHILRNALEMISDHTDVPIAETGWCLIQMGRLYQSRDKTENAARVFRKARKTLQKLGVLNRTEMNMMGKYRNGRVN